MPGEYELVTAPAEGSNVTRPTSATSARIQLPSRWKGRYLRVTALTANVAINFGDSAVDVDYTKENTVGSEAITLDDTVGLILLAGTYVDIFVGDGYTDAGGVPRKPTHMAYECNTGESGQINLAVVSR